MTDGVKVTDGTVAFDSIKPHPKNPTRHPEKQIAAIAAAIEKYGYVDKLVVRPNSMLIGGEGRWLALQRLPELSSGKIDVRIVHGLTETQYRALGLALNKLSDGSTTDDVILHEVLAGLVQEGEDPLGMGFTEKEMASILDSAADELEVREIETGDVEDEFWISVRGPLKHQAEMLKRLEKAAKGLDSVTVDLGTIAVGP
jgi:ParB/Sulfiredoxin domain